MKYWNSVVDFFSHSGRNDIFAWLAVLFAGAAYLPYLWKIIKRKARPAIAPWFLWASLSLLNYFASRSAGEAYPQTLMYAILDPVVLVIAIWMRNWNTFDTEDKVALVIGLTSCFVFYFSAKYALIGALTGITIAGIPIMKNVWRDPESESLSGWILFALGGSCSLLSGIVFYTTWIDILTPATYAVSCGIIVTLILARKHRLSNVR